MSTVQSFKECPQCKGVCITEFNIRTQEESRICFKCGRTESWVLDRDVQNKVILDKEGKPILKHELSQGYGIAKIRYDDGIGTFKVYKNFVDQVEKDAFYEHIEDAGINKELSYLTKWDSAKQEIVCLFGEMPPSFEEFAKDNQDEEN